MNPAALHTSGALLEVVIAEFAFLEPDYGLRLAEASTGPLRGPSRPIGDTPLAGVDAGWTVFRWMSVATEFRFTLAPSRHEVDFSFQRAGTARDDAVTMAEVFAFLHPAAAEGYERTYFVHGGERWPEVVPRMAAGVRRDAGPWLRGDPQAHAQVRRFIGLREALHLAEREGHVTSERMAVLRDLFLARRFASLREALADASLDGVAPVPSHWLAQATMHAQRLATADDDSGRRSPNRSRRRTLPP